LMKPVRIFLKIAALGIILIFLLLGGIIFWFFLSSSSYDPQKDQQTIQDTLYEFYLAYQLLESQKIYYLTSEPLLTWEQQHLQNTQPLPSNSFFLAKEDFKFTFQKLTPQEAEVWVARNNFLQNPLPFQLGKFLRENKI